MSEKHFRLFLFMVAASVLLMTYQSKLGVIRPFGFLSVTLNYLNQSITSVKTSVKDIVRIVTLNEDELHRLRKEVRLLKLKEQRFDELHLENRRLLKALGLKEREPRYLGTAKVVGRGMERWAGNIVIDKGTEDSVLKGMAVMTTEGLLGKIQEAQGAFSTVLLMEDKRFSAAVRLQGKRTGAVLSGAGNGRCTLKYLSIEEAVAEGAEVVTSGLDGLFPSGIRAGYISKVSTDPDELFHRIEVIPFVDLKEVEEVIILKR
jgi:rod shape-determining protein MreC